MNRFFKAKKIVGGNKAQPMSLPWFVSLKKHERVGWNVKTFLCGATLICPKVVISAAHCLERRTSNMQYPDLSPEYYELHFGRQLNPAMHWHPKTVDQVRARGIDIEKVIVHPNFVVKNQLRYDDPKKALQKFDIAIFVLKKAVVFNDLVRPGLLLTIFW